MESVLNRIDPLFVGLWHSTWQASVLIGLVLIFQRILRKQLSPGWRYSLWLVVVARLALPVTPESVFSIFNVPLFDAFRPPMAIGQFNQSLSTPPVRRLSEDGTWMKLGAPSDAAAAVSIADGNSTKTSSNSGPSAVVKVVATWIAPIWLFGVLLQVSRICWQNLRFARQVKDRVPVTKPELLELLEECKRMLKIRLPITLFETPMVKSPALYGLFRPRLLLPHDLTESFSRQELRHILLHELAHVKRSDMVLNWLMTVLQTLHWFNPLVWFAFSRMRSDREAACDALVLTCLNEEDPRSYGATIIKLLESFTRPATSPNLMGILEVKHQMRRRIKMIALFSKPSRWSAWATLLLFGLGLVGLTDARIPQTTLTPGASAFKPLKPKVVPDTIHVSGKVFDEKTDEPVNSFQLFVREWKRFTNDTGSVESRGISPSGIGTNGEFSLSIRTDYLISFEVEIRAEGYVTKRSGWLELEDDVGPHVYSLARSIPLEGSLRMPDGQPAAGVEVALWTEETPAFFDQSGFLNRHFRHITCTDAEGKFAFLPALEVLGIIAVDERGYAENVKEPSLTPQRLTLRPWGRVEGSLMVGRQAGRGERVGLRRVGQEMFPQTVTTDDSGRFVFERVPPGEFTLSRAVNGELFTGISVRVRSGETIHAKLGGTGCKIVGRFTWPASGPTVDWKSKNWEVSFHSKNLPPPGSLPVSLQPDGSFTVEDVPPGVYQLEVLVREIQETETAPSANERNVVAPLQLASTNVQVASTKSGLYAWGKAVAVFEKTIDVPETLPNADNPPLEVGTLELRPLPTALTSRK